MKLSLPQRKKVKRTKKLSVKEHSKTEKDDFAEDDEYSGKSGDDEFGIYIFCCTLCM